MSRCIKYVRAYHSLFVAGCFTLNQSLIMELGLAPDDDSLFEKVAEKQQKPECQQSYTAKNCYPLVIKTYAGNG